MSLSFLKRTKLTVRIMLSAGLRLVPAIIVRIVHRAYTAGRMRVVLRPVVAVLRHRPLAPMRDFPMPGAPEVRMVAAESRLTRLLYWHGAQGYEGVASEIWRRLCGDATVVVELGANVGYYTVLGAQALRAGARYTAVEANPESADILRENLKLNRLSHVNVVQAAVLDVDEPGHVELALPDQERYAAPTGAFLPSRAEGIEDRPASRTVRVPTIPAANVLADADLIKLDIEGCEAAVLDAVRAELNKGRPTIVVEVLRTAARLRSLLLELHEDGYLVFAIGRTSLHLLTTQQLQAHEPLPRYGSRDVVLTPAESANRL